jgi:hypothetical protein
VPAAVKELVMTGAAGGEIVRVNVAVPVPLAFVALRVTLKLPLAVGVPEIAPVEVLTLNPEGNPVALKLVGLPLAVTV